MKRRPCPRNRSKSPIAAVSVSFVGDLIVVGMVKMDRRATTSRAINIREPPSVVCSRPRAGCQALPKGDGERIKHCLFCQSCLETEALYPAPPALERCNCHTAIP